ncbi:MULTISPECIES: septum formation family protein [unclassified Diaminobutyricimonas]|uniref:septum formation family protein n=1 Tax=unclassified Diaminobutyricimonas TaxID=2643261 RepID=UPI0012F52747|nr:MULTISPECIES: septum formation family protein [unclassified Diaminobutyricimonas]
MFRNLGVVGVIAGALVLAGCAGTPSSEAPSPGATVPTPQHSYEVRPIATPEADLQVGDCLDADRVVVSCDEEHISEVHLVLTLPDPIGTPYPELTDLHTRVNAADEAAMIAYFGGMPTASYSSEGPGLSEDEWNEGDRLVIRSFAFIKDTNGERIPVTGSLRGTFGEQSSQ